MQFSFKCVFGPRLRSPNRLQQKTQKPKKIGNVQNGALARIITRSSNVAIRPKCVWATPAQSKRVKTKTCLGNGTGSAFLSLETFERVGQHVPKQSRTPQSCAWPTYPPIFLSIHLHSTLAKQAKTAYCHPKAYENTRQGPPKWSKNIDLEAKGHAGSPKKHPRTRKGH